VSKARRGREQEAISLYWLLRAKTEKWRREKRETKRKERKGAIYPADLTTGSMA
jgi:hypothetical protein